MRVDPGISVIVPCLNEAPRIENVLRGLQHIPYLREVVVVDDGSTDGSLAVALGLGARVVRAQTNHGKAAAMAAGLATTAGEILMFVDADIDKVDEFAMACGAQRMLEVRSTSMVLLRRDAVSLLNLETAFTGERFVRRGVIERALTRNPRGYQVEAAMNLEAMRSGEVVWVQSTSRNLHKTHKHGLLRGLAREVDMYAQILAYAGLGGVASFIALGSNSRRIR